MAEDTQVATTPRVVVGSGVRRSKLTLPGTLLARLPGAVVIDGLARRPDGGRYKQEQESP